MPVFLTGLSRAQTFSTGSPLRSSYRTRYVRCLISRNTVICGLISYCDCDQQARPLHLAHVRDANILVRLEAADDPPAGAYDAHMAIDAAEEEAVGAGEDAGYLVAFEEGARFVVIGELDLADIEEVEGFPL